MKKALEMLPLQTSTSYRPDRSRESEMTRTKALSGATTYKFPVRYSSNHNADPSRLTQTFKPARLLLQFSLSCSYLHRNSKICLLILTWGLKLLCMFFITSSRVALTLGSVNLEQTLFHPFLYENLVLMNASGSSAVGFL